MKKVLLFTIMMTASLCLSAQNVNDLISEKTKDGAYSAPNTMLVNKKWFSFDKDLDIGVNYYFFRANKTGEYAKPTTYKDFSYEEVIPFTWSRDHNDLTISMDFKNMTYRKIVYKDPSASERTKAEIKKTVEALIEEDKKNVRMIDSYVLKYYINRLDAKIFLLEGLKLELKGGGRSQTDSCDDLFLCTEVGKKDMEETKKKAEEEKMKAEEAKKKAEEEAKMKKDADALNEKAYEQAREEKYADAIATIDMAIVLFPKDPNYYDSKGEILFNMGDKDGAKAMWDKVVSLDPKYSENKSTLYLMLFEPTDIDFDSELTTFEDIGGRIIKRKNGDNSISISDEDFDKFKEIWNKIVDNSRKLTLKQQERAKSIIKKVK